MPVAAAILSLAACTKNPSSPVEPAKMPISISLSGWTKVTDVAYESGDKVGIYVVNYNADAAGALSTTGNHVDNMRFTCDGSQWIPDSEIYWLDDKTKADFYCYYPYSTLSDVNSWSISVKADQSDRSNYKASEFLWGKTAGAAPSDKTVQITTNRLCSNVLVYLTAGKGFTEETFAAATKSVKIRNVKVNANVSLATGATTATGTAADVVPFNEGDYWRALIPAQTADITMTATVNGVDYNLTKTFTFVANTQHKFTLTVNKTSSGINIGVGDWKIDGGDNGGSAE